jgi:hypothetical protein
MTKGPHHCLPVPYQYLHQCGIFLMVHVSSITWVYISSHPSISVCHSTINWSPADIPFYFSGRSPQSMGFSPCSFSNSLQREKWPHPKNPRCAESGEGCVDISKWCRFWAE